MSMARVALSLAYVLAGLLGRALIDKLLAARVGTEAVAGWAQLSNLADLVSGASLTGVGIALTAMAAASHGRERLAWLKPALLLCLSVSLALLLLLLPLLFWLDTRLAPGAPLLPLLALAVGWLAVAPGLLVAWQLGSRHAGRAAALVAAQAALSALFLVLPPSQSPLLNLLLAQALFNLCIGLALFAYLRRQEPVAPQAWRSLLRFLPAGLAIGILSPASSAWSRLQIAGEASWQVAGQVQAIWRTSDWITAIVAGLLNAYFLPRLAAARERPVFVAELRRAATTTLLPASALLALLWLWLPEALSLLYRADMAVARRDALFFLLGDGLRMLSWLALFGLFARKQAWAITLGEFFSLPLFALLLTAFSGPLEIRQIGLMWLATYAAYAACNAALLWISWPRERWRLRPD